MAKEETEAITLSEEDIKKAWDEWDALSEREKNNKRKTKYCRDCSHWSGFLSKMKGTCDYILDERKPRKCPPPLCKKLGKFKSKTIADSKVFGKIPVGCRTDIKEDETYKSDKEKGDVYTSYLFESSAKHKHDIHLSRKR